MGKALTLRGDYSSDLLCSLARASDDADCTRRLLALSIIYDGGTRTEAARFGGVGLQIIRDWVVRFNARGPDGLVNGKSPGRRPLLSDEQRQALAALVDKGPNPSVDGIVRWRLCDLVRWIEEEFGIVTSRQTVARELRSMGYRKLSARPRHHAQDPDAIDEFKKTSQPLWQKSENIKQRGSR